MPLPDHFLDSFARRIVAGTGEGARVPRQQQMSLHMGTLMDVDPITGTAHFAVNGSDLVIPGVRYLQAYSPSYSPSPGHKVWAQYTGTDLMILGQHVLPISTVTF